MLVKVRPKFQITIPVALCEKTKLKVGDLLEFSFDEKNDVIKLTPKRVVNRKDLRAA